MGADYGYSGSIAAAGLYTRAQRADAQGGGAPAMLSNAAERARLSRSVCEVFAKKELGGVSVPSGFLVSV